MDNLIKHIEKGFAFSCGLPGRNGERKWEVHQIGLDHNENQFDSIEEALNWLVKNQVV